MLADDIKKRMFAAIKAKNNVEKEILRVALGEIQVAESRSGLVSEEAAVAIVRKLVKSNQETLSLSENDEQKRVLREEIGILETFLPRVLSSDEILALLAEVADPIRAAGSAGQATGIAMKHLKTKEANVAGKDVALAVEKLRAP